MDAILATVTVISLSMAFAMGIVTWRLMREERRRADAAGTIIVDSFTIKGDQLDASANGRFDSEKGDWRANFNVDAELVRRGGMLQKEEKLIELSNGCI